MHHVAIRQEIIDRVLARRGRLHLFDRLAPARTAVVVIDMQNTFCQPGAPAEVPLSRAIVGAINRLNDGVRARGGRVIWVTHANLGAGAGSDWGMFFDNFVADDVRARTIESLAPGGPGQRIWPELAVADGDLAIFKNRYSALIPGSSSLERLCRSLGIDTLLITGTKTNVCCESTARDAMMLDFNVVMVSDATAALSDEEHRATLETIIQQFGDVLSVDETLARLDAGRHDT
ncbi:MAG: cysteine hydrolase [Rhodobacteraceae bacterium]|jgi:ureidoacrylate peracid hydrolase|nr:cysteine hydrolase [Paracoccaceae bacterium]